MEDVVFVDLAVSNNLWFDDSLVTRSVHIYTLELYT